MFSPLANLLESCGLSRAVRRGWSVFSRRPCRLGLRSHRPANGLAIEGLSAAESLEMRRLMAVDISLVGSVLTIAFDDTSDDAISLSINASGYSATGANVTSGTGTISQLIVTDAGTAKNSDLTLLQADQVLTGGLFIASNITAARIEDSINTSGGDISIAVNCLTSFAGITIDSGAGNQTYAGPVTLLGDVTMNATGGLVPSGLVMKVDTVNNTFFIEGTDSGAAVFSDPDYDLQFVHFFPSGSVSSSQQVTATPETLFVEAPSLSFGAMNIIDGTQDYVFLDLGANSDITTLTGAGVGSAQSYAGLNATNEAAFESLIGQTLTQSIGTGYSPITVQDANQGLPLITFASTVDGGYSLTTNGATTFSAGLGSGTPLSSLTVDAGTEGTATFSGTAATVTGNVSVTARNIVITADLVSTSGDISLTGDAGSTVSGVFHGVHINGSGVEVKTLATDLIAGATGAITVQGRGGDAVAAGSGVSPAFGVYLQAGAALSAGGSGDVNVTGIGGVSTSASFSSGVLVSNSNEANGVSEIVTAGGSIFVTGTAGGASGTNDNYGVSVNSFGRITAGGSGSVSVTGTATDTGGTGNSGVIVTNFIVASQNTPTAAIISSGGEITITGTGTASGAAVVLRNAGKVASGGSGNVTVIADSLEFDTSGWKSASPATIGSITAGAAGNATVTIQPSTAGTLIDLGGFDSLTSPLTLGLSTDEIDRITAGTLSVGSATAGVATVSIALTPANVTNLAIRSGAGVTLAGHITTDGGTITIDDGAGGDTAVTLANSALLDTTNSGATSAGAAVTVRGTVTSDTTNIPLQIQAGTDGDVLVTDTIGAVGAGQAPQSVIVVGNDITLASIDGVLGNSSIEAVDGTNTGSITLTGQTYSTNGGLNLSAGPRDPSNVVSNPITLTGGLAESTTTISTAGGPVELSGAIDLNGRSLSIDTTAGGSVAAGGQVLINDAIDGVGSLTIDAGTAGIVDINQLSGAVGGSTPLTAVILTNAGEAYFRRALAAGTLTITDATHFVQLAGVVTLATGLVTTDKPYDLEFYGGVGSNSIAGATTFLNTGDVQLGIAANSIFTFIGGVVATAPAAISLSATIAATTGVITLGDADTLVTVVGLATVGGDSTGDITLADVLLGQTATLVLGTGVANTIQVGSITGTTGSVGEQVTIDTTGTATVTGAVGTDIGAVTITNSGGTTFQSAVNATQVSLVDTTGTVTFQGVLTAETLLTNPAAYAVAILGGGSELVNEVEFTNTGGVTLGDGGDTLTFPRGLTSTAGPTTLAGTLITDSPAADIGAPSRFGDLTLAADSVINAGSGNVTFNGRVDSDATGWAAQGGGVNTISSSIAAFADGSSITTGFFVDVATFGSTTLSGTGQSDAFITKLNPDGTYAWATAVGGLGDDRGEGVATLTDGSSIITGYFTDEATFGQTTLTGTGQQMFVAKLDADGEFVWATQAGGAGDDQGLSVSVLADGSAVLTGVFTGTATFGSSTLVSAGGRDVFVAKVDPSGEFVWATRAGGSGDDDGMGVSALADGSSIILTGGFEGAATFGSTTLNASGSSDVFVAKLDGFGSFAWATQAGGNGIDFGEGVSMFADGSAVLTGAFEGVATFGSFTLNSSDFLDIFIAKVDANGTFVWATSRGGTSGGTAIDVGHAVAALADGTALVVGQLSNATSAYGYQAKLDANGVVVWTRLLGGTGDSIAFGVAALPDGVSLVAGGFDDTVGLGGVPPLQSDGNANAFIYRAVESDVDGDYSSLTVTTTGDVAFNAPVGATGRLAGLNVTSDNVVLQDVTTSVVMNHSAAGAQLYSGNATLNGVLTTNGGNFTVGGTTTLTGDTTVFTGTLNSGNDSVLFSGAVDGLHALTINASNMTTFSAPVGGGTPLASLTVDGPADLAGDVEFTVLATIAVGGQPFGVAVSPDGMLAYVANQVSDTVSVIDVATNLVIDTIPTGSSTGPRGVALSPDGSRLYVTNLNNGSVTVIDTATNMLVTTVAVGDFPSGVAVSPDGTVVYVANGLSNTVSVINATTNAVIETIPVGNFPNAVAFSPDGAVAYVANSNSGTVSVINTATNTVSAVISGMSLPQWIVVSPDGSTAYVSNGGTDSIVVLNTTSNTIITTIAVGQGPYGIAMSGDGARVYVANQVSSDVSVIDTATNTVIDTLAVGSQPIGVAVSPDGDRIYVTDVRDNTVSVMMPAIAISTEGDQNYNGSVAVAAAASLASSTGNVAITGDITGNGSLNITANQQAVFQGTAGTLAAPLARLTVSAPSITTAGAATTGPQSYTGMLTLNGSYTTTNSDIEQFVGCGTLLTGDTTLNTGSGNVALCITSSSPANSATLMIDSTGNTTLGTVINLQGLTITGGTATLSGAWTAGPQTYGGNVVLSGAGDRFYQTQNATITINGTTTLADGANTTFTTGTAHLTFGSTVDGAGCLSLASTGQTFLNGTVGGTTPLVDLTAAAGSNVSLDGDVTTTGNQTFLGDLTLVSNATLTAGTPSNGSGGNGSNGSNGSNTTGTSGSILFGGSLAPAALTQTLSLNATTNITLPEIGRTTTPFASIDALANLTLLTGDITTIGDQHYRGRAVATQDLDIVACLGTITFGGGLDSINTALTPNVSIQTAGNVVFSAPVGGTATGQFPNSTFSLGALNVTAANIAIAGIGGIRYGATSANLTATDSQCGTLNFTGLLYNVLGNARYDASGSEYRFTSQTPGEVSVVTTSGDLDFIDGDVSLSDNVSLFASADSGGRMLINGNIDGTSGENIRLFASSNAVVVNGTIGSGSGKIRDVLISAGSGDPFPVLLSGDIYGGINGNDIVSISGNITLSGDRAIVTAGEIRINGSLDANATGGGNLALLTASNVSLGSIGATTPLSNLSITANATTLGGPTIATTGPQTYTSNLTLAADIAIDSANGNVTFNRRIDGARQLGITAGTGNVNFFQALGSTTPLQGLNLASAAAVEALSTLAIDGTGGSGPGLRIGADVNNVNLAQPGSTITNANLAGILLAGNSTGSTIGGFTITNSGGAGIVAQPGDYLATRLENNTISGSGGDGIMANGTANLTVAESSIRDNAGQGLMFYAASDSRAINNTIGGNDFYGIVVQTAAQNVTLTGNRIGVTASNQSIPNGRSGIFILDNVNDAVVQGNIVSGNAVHGIEVNGSQNITIGGNRDFGEENVISGNAQYGLAFTNVVTGSRALGNDLTGNTQAGLYLNSAQGVVIGHIDSDQALAISQSDFGVVAGGDLIGTQLVGNSIQNNRTAGLQLLAAQNLNLFRNLVSNNGPYGLLAIGDSTGSQVAGNTIQRHGAGIWLAHASGMAIGSMTGTTVPEVATVANKIIDNDSVGIIIQGASSLANTILSNSIYANAFYGIQMVDGAVPNLAPPTITTATTTQVTGSISGTDGEVYRIQYFKSSSDVTVASQLPQGQTLIAYQDVTISGGTASINLDISSAGVIASDWITATATLLSSGSPVATSAFSPGVQVMQ